MSRPALSPDAFAAPGGPDCEAVLGESARALEARSRADTDAWHEPAEIFVSFTSAALGSAERAALDAASALVCAPSREPGGGRELLRGPRDALAGLAEAHPGLSPLLAAHDLAARAPGPPRLLGVVNVTPDSFSDGGRFLDPDRAVEHGLKLVAEGVEILDVGGESTRPGSASVPAEVEMERVIPVVERLARSAGVPVSIDTTKADVAEAALDAGAAIVNDVSAARFDERMLPLVAERGAGLILMHMQSTPERMQDAPDYVDVVREVTAHLRERAACAWRAGVEPSRLAIDPGLGFGKRLRDNLDLVRALPELRSLGLSVVLGVSRKSFLGRLSGENRPELRGAESLAAASIGCALGAELHRVHDVSATRAALAVASALRPEPAGRT